MLHSLRRFVKSEVAQQRLKIIRFYDNHGEAATKEAFGADRKVIHVWKKRLKANENELQALIPGSTRPRRVRSMNTEPMIVEFIRATRKNHPRLGKEKIKPLLDVFCREKGIGPISESTIGKVIKRQKFFYQKSERIYHDPGSWAATRKHTMPPRLRVKHPPKHTEFGHFQADTTFQFIEGVRRYLISAIDTKLKFSFSACYSQLTSKNSADFMEKLQAVYPLEVKTVQTDNGSEFLGHFEHYLRSQHIRHYFTYPRCPRINGCIERFNRTLKEEFVTHNLALLPNLELFRKQLVEYLVFYNTERPHKALNLKSPIQYLVSEGVMSNMSVTYTSN